MTSYEGMARELGIGWCGGIMPTGHYCPLEHRLNGTASDGTVHFSERPVTRPNTLAFLKLAAQVIDPSLADESMPWRRVYRMNMLVRQMGWRLRARVPTSASRMDRAFVLAGVAGVPNSVPMRKQAFDWARRGPKPR